LFTFVLGGDDDRAQTHGVSEALDVGSGEDHDADLRRAGDAADPERRLYTASLGGHLASAS
jgi:hypothetical protein